MLKLSTHEQIRIYVNVLPRWTSNVEIYDMLLTAMIESYGAFNTQDVSKVFTIEDILLSLALSENISTKTLVPLVVRYLPEDYDGSNLMKSIMNISHQPENFIYHLILTFKNVDWLNLNVEVEQLKMIETFYDQV